jgi:hypothetical protein
VRNPPPTVRVPARVLRDLFDTLVGAERRLRVLAEETVGCDTADGPVSSRIKRALGDISHVADHLHSLTYDLDVDG